MNHFTMKSSQSKLAELIYSSTSYSETTQIRHLWKVVAYLGFDHRSLILSNLPVSVFVVTSVQYYNDFTQIAEDLSP